MRYREPFTIFPREMKSGLVVWYYQTYDKNNRRTTARSTGQTLKSAARAYCNKLYKEDALIPSRGGNIFFEKYAEGWWTWDKCEYIKYRLSRRELSKNYIYSGHTNLKLHIKPYFGKMRLGTITNYDIEKWLLTFAAKGLSNLTANMNLTFLNIMLTDAIRRGILDINPADKVSPLKKDTRERGILSLDEVSRIFDYNSIWRIWRDKIYYLANLLSACSGLRASEILAIRGEVLFDGYINVADQYHRIYGLQPTKTRDSRQVPLPTELQKELEILRIESGGKYLFSVSEGEKPVCIQSLNSSLKRAMTTIGIPPEEQKKRNICFHSWRHFFNTIMRANNISDGKLQKLTGHKSMAMTEHYTHFKADDFQDVKEIQEKILQMPTTAG
jgi:integrase